MGKKTKRKFNIIIIIAIVLLAIATIPKTFQEDTFYMIKVGEYICENGMQVIQDRIEPFSWHEGLIYTYPHWLFDVILYVIFSIFSSTGIYVFTVIMGVIIYLLIYYTNVKICKNNIISAIITIVSIYLLSGYITARSQIVTYLCLILTILFIERFLENSKKRYLIGLILIPIILANCHAALFPIYFVLYLPYFAEFVISFFRMKNLLQRRIDCCQKKKEKISKKLANKKLENKISRKINKIEKKISKLENKLILFEKDESTKQRKVVIERNKNVKWLILVFVLALFTGLLTPLKDIPYTYMARSIIGNTMHFISEHQAVEVIYFLPLLGIMLLLYILLFSNRVRIRLRDIFMLLGMGILALISYKQFPIFWICTMCIINKLVSMIVTEKQKDLITKVMKKVLSIKGLIYVVLVLVIIFLLQYKNIIVQPYIDTNSYPVSAVKWLKNNVNVKEIKLFNDFNYGSYLLFEDIPVFIDGRADVYDPAFNGKEDDVFLDYMQASSLQVWYEDVFKKYGVTNIMTMTNSQLDIYLQRNISYEKIYNDGIFSIYEKR